MIHVPLYSAPSPTHGSGAFISANVPRGTIVVSWPSDIDMLTNEATHDASHHGITSSIRLVGNVFMVSRAGTQETVDYQINHADDPNLLYAFGLCIARRDIAKGEELTVDYRLMCSEKQTDVVQGMAWEDVLSFVTAELRNIYATP